MLPKHAPFLKEEIPEIKFAIEYAERFSLMSLSEENENLYRVALEALKDLKMFIAASAAEENWIHDPRLVFEETIKLLFKLKGLWARNLASHLRYQIQIWTFILDENPERWSRDQG
jgi:hypothetical protein